VEHDHDLDRHGAIFALNQREAWPAGTAGADDCEGACCFNAKGVEYTPLTDHEAIIDPGKNREPGWLRRIRPAQSSNSCWVSFMNGRLAAPSSNAHPTERLATLIDEIRGRNFRNGVSRRDGTASLDAPRLQVPAFPRQD
jgi:hypothetical protein